MTETSQQIPSISKPPGQKGDIITRNTARFAKLSPDTAPVLPKGLKGHLARNPDFGKNDGLYHPPFHFSTNPMDVLDPQGRFKLKEIEDVISPGFPD